MLRYLTTCLGCLLFLSLAGQQPQPTSTPNFSDFPADTTQITNTLQSLTDRAYHRHPEFGQLPDDAPCDNCMELVDKRTANKRHFVEKGTNGQLFHIQKSKGALHYQGANGFWLDINPQLEQPANGNHVYTASRQPFPTRVNRSDLSCGLQLGQQWVDFEKNLTFQWISEQDTAEIPASTFSQITVGADGLQAKSEQSLTLEHRVQRGAVKTNYLLEAPTAIPPEAQWLCVQSDVQLPANYYLATKEGQLQDSLWRGSIGIYGPQHQLVATIGAPYIHDDARQTMPQDFGYQFEKSKNGNYHLTLKVKADWLRSPKRSFPVTIDPLKMAADSNDAIIGFEPSSFCFDENEYCPENLTITAPGQSTLVAASSEVQVSTVQNGCGGSCDFSKAGLRIYGPCPNTQTPSQQDSFLIPKSNNFDFQPINLYPNIDCQTSSCDDHELTFEMRTYSCSCPGDDACGTACHYINEHNWSITVSARTLEGKIEEGETMEVCAWETVSFNAEGNYGVPPYSWQWLPFNETGDGFSYVPVEDTMVIVETTDQCGNSVNDTIHITAHPLPDIAFTDILPACQGQSSGEATAEVNNLNGTPTYEWSTNPVQNGASATGLAAGKYYVTVTSPEGCTSIDSVEITQPPNALSIDVTKTDVSCNATTDGSATVNINDGNAPYDILWSNGSTDNTISNLAGGTYEVTVTDSEGCVDVDSAVVENAGNLSLDITVDSITCNGSDNGVVAVDATGDQPPFDYEWNTGATGEEINNGLGPGTYTVTVTDDNGCEAEKSATLEEPAPLQLDIESFPVTCDGSTSMNGMAIANPSGGTPPYQFHWNTSPNQFTDTADQLGAGTYSISVTDANDCEVTGSATIDPPANYTVSFDTIPVTCYGGSDGEVTVNVDGGTEPYEYAWNTPGNHTTKTVTGLSAGFYTVTITDAGNCLIAKNVQISQPEAINADIIASNVTCPGAENGEATVIPKGGNPPYSVQWSTGETDTQETQSNLAMGEYEVYITDSEDCTDTIPIVINGPDEIDYSTDVNHASCQGIDDGAIFLEYSGGRPPLFLEWEDGLPDEDTLMEMEAGTYRFTITDGNGCTKTDSVTIENLTTLQWDAEIIDASCTGTEDGSIEVDVTGGNEPYTIEWSTGADTDSLANIDAGAYAVTATDANGCTADSTFVVHALDSIMVELGPDTSIPNGEAVLLDPVIEPGGDYTYTWNPGTGLSDSTGIPATATPPFPTTYRLTVSSANGCRASDSIFIDIRGESRVPRPNAFTPNGDGRNDLFFDLPNTSIRQISIFNRWGEMVYQGSEPWDGTQSDGSPAPMGQYVYTGEVRYYNSDRIISVKGTVLLIR